MPQCLSGSVPLAARDAVSHSPGQQGGYFKNCLMSGRVKRTPSPRHLWRLETPRCLGAEPLPARADGGGAPRTRPQPGLGANSLWGPVLRFSWRGECETRRETQADKVGAGAG